MLFDSPEAIEALEFYVSLFDDAIADKRENQPIGNLPVLAAGAVARSSPPWKTSRPSPRTRPTSIPTCAWLRRSRGSSPRAWYSFAGFFMAKQSANKEATWEVLQFLTSPEALEALTYSLSGLPPRASLAGVPHVAEDPNVIAFMDGLSAARFNPNIPIWVNARDALSSARSSGRSGGLSRRPRRCARRPMK